MTIQSVQSGFIQFCSTVYNATKVATLWLGRNIQLGFNNYVVPLLKAVWASTLPYLVSLKNLIVTGKCPPLLVAAILFAVGIASFKIVDRKAYEDNTTAMKAWTSVGIVSFIGMTIFATLGIGSISA